MSTHDFSIFHFNYKTIKIPIQLFQGIKNISMSFIKSKICNTQSPQLQKQNLKRKKVCESCNLLALQEANWNVPE